MQTLQNKKVIIMIGINVNKNNNQLKNSFFNFLFKFIAHINSIKSETKFFFPLTGMD